ncbi:hypothetical protein [Rubritalea squalenifaciens]|nr:hypothetical protein [Rubritalea squalenifaciens]
MKLAIIISSVSLFLPLSAYSEVSEGKSNIDSIVNRVSQIIGVWELFESRDQDTGEVIKNPLSLRIEFFRDGTVVMKHQQEGVREQREDRILRGEYAVSRNFITIYGRDNKRGWRYSEHYRYTLKGGILEFTINSEEKRILKLKKAEQDGAPKP